MTIAAHTRLNVSKHVVAAAAVTVVTIGGVAAGGLVLASNQGEATIKAPAASPQGFPPPVRDGTSHSQAPDRHGPERLHGGHIVIGP